MNHFKHFFLVLVLLLLFWACAKPKYTCAAYYSAFNSETCMPLIDSTTRILVHPPPSNTNDTAYLATVEINHVDSSVHVEHTVIEDIRVTPDFEYFIAQVTESPDFESGYYVPPAEHGLLKDLSDRERRKYQNNVVMLYDYKCIGDSLDDVASEEYLLDDAEPKRKKKDKEYINKEWEVETQNTKIK